MFTVYMPREALTDLHDAWLDGCASSRAALEQSVACVRNKLQEDPAALGESRGSDDERIVVGCGVAATFQIDWQRRFVRVVRAWPVRRAA